MKKKRVLTENDRADRLRLAQGTHHDEVDDTIIVGYILVDIHS